MTTTSERDNTGRFTAKTLAEKLTGIPERSDQFRAFDLDWDRRTTPLGYDVAWELTTGYASEVTG